MFFKFILYNLIFQIGLAIVMILKIGILDFSALTDASFLMFFVITILVNIPIYFLIKWSENNWKIKKEFLNYIKLSKYYKKYIKKN